MGKSTGRFGTRYGRRIRNLFYNIEKDQKKKQKCPYCSYVNVKRVSNGIYKCTKCDTKFTGKAYVSK